MKRTLAFITLSCVLAGSVHAQILRYQLSSSSSEIPETWSASTVAPGLTADPLSRGPGIVGAALGTGFSADHWNSTNGTPSETATLANAIATGDYFQFGLTVSAGYEASLSTLDLSLRRSAVSSPNNFQWQYSLDGFATSGIDFADFQYWGRNSGTAPGNVTPYQWMTTDTPGQGNGNPLSTLDLTGISAFQNIAGGTTITFRLYAWGRDSNPGTDSNTLAMGRINGPTFGGTVSLVPEPSALALAGLGMSLALIFRRRA